MMKNLFLLVGEFILTFSILTSANLCTANMKLKKELKLKNEDFKTNDTELIKASEKNNTLTTLNGIWFWTVPDVKKTTERVPPETDVLDIRSNQDEESDDKESFGTKENLKGHSNNNKFAIVEPAISGAAISREEVLHEVFPQKLKDSFQVNKTIMMSRSNCHAEIAVHENRDTKLTIKFGRLQNNSYGRCCLTLHGYENSMLGVIISNVHLYRNKTQGEVLKVIVGNRYSAFTLKEYYGSKDNEPLLLTETHKVYLVLNYRAEYAAPSQDCTYFNLEVFTYQKHENNIHHYDYRKDNYNHKDVAYINQALNVCSSKKKDNFIPYVYDKIYY